MMNVTDSQITDVMRALGRRSKTMTAKAIEQRRKANKRSVEARKAIRNNAYEKKVK